MIGGEQDGETRARGAGQSSLPAARGRALRQSSSPFAVSFRCSKLVCGYEVKVRRTQTEAAQAWGLQLDTSGGANSGPPPYPQYKCLAKKRQANSTTGTKSFAVEKLSGQRGSALVCIGRVTFL